MVQHKQVLLYDSWAGMWATQKCTLLVEGLPATFSVRETGPYMAGQPVADVAYYVGCRAMLPRPALYTKSLPYSKKLYYAINLYVGIFVRCAVHTEWYVS